MVMWDAQSMMNDYRQIWIGPTSEPYKRQLRPNDIALDHENAKVFIQSEIIKHKQLNNKVIVMTHHAPSYLSKLSYIPSGDALLPCYCSSMENFILDNNPDIWIHGHIHESKDYKVGDTRVVANPYGYYPADLNEEFEPNWLLEL